MSEELFRAKRSLGEIERRMKGLKDKITREQRGASASERRMLDGFEESMRLHRAEVARLGAEAEVDEVMGGVEIEVCPSCGGSGLERGYRVSGRCPMCGGSGQVLRE